MQTLKASESYAIRYIRWIMGENTWFASGTTTDCRIFWGCVVTTIALLGASVCYALGGFLTWALMMEYLNPSPEFSQLMEEATIALAIWTIICGLYVCHVVDKLLSLFKLDKFFEGNFLDLKHSVHSKFDKAVLWIRSKWCKEIEFYN